MGKEAIEKSSLFYLAFFPLKVDIWKVFLYFKANRKAYDSALYLCGLFFANILVIKLGALQSWTHKMFEIQVEDLWIKEAYILSGWDGRWCAVGCSWNKFAQSTVCHFNVLPCLLCYLKTAAEVFVFCAHSLKVPFLIRFGVFWCLYGSVPQWCCWCMWYCPSPAAEAQVPGPLLHGSCSK